MKAFLLASAALCSLTFLSGCTSKMARPIVGADMSVASLMPASAPVQSERDSGPLAARMVAWRASLNVEVWNVSNAVARATALAESRGGFVEQKSDHGETSARLTLRIPAPAFRGAMSTLEELGTVTYRDVRGEDVTEEYVDVEARLKNKVVLRDRLKQLLDKAVDVKDVLAIETELNRVQGDIDSMEGRIRLLKNQVELATVTLSLERKAVLGPLGYLFKGAWWGVEKLFVLRE